MKIKSTGSAEVPGSYLRHVIQNDQEFIETFGVISKKNCQSNLAKKIAMKLQKFLTIFLLIFVINQKEMLEKLQ
jgi:hypothetical protein